MKKDAVAYIPPPHRLAALATSPVNGGSYYAVIVGKEHKEKDFGTKFIASCNSPLDNDKTIRSFLLPQQSDQPPRRLLCILR